VQDKEEAQEGGHDTREALNGEPFLAPDADIAMSDHQGCSNREAEFEGDVHSRGCRQKPRPIAVIYMRQLDIGQVLFKMTR
jgi:hypothetical protein